MQEDKDRRVSKRKRDDLDKREKDEEITKKKKA